MMNGNRTPSFTPRPLEARIAIVTGAGQGIGRAIAQRLAGAGATVVVNDVKSSDAHATTALINERGDRALAYPGDITLPSTAKDLVEFAIEQGGIDVVVNNAGYTWDGVVQKMSDEQFDAMLEIHLRAPFRVLRAAQPFISSAAKREIAETGAAQCRKVVNVSSVSGLSGTAGQANYSAAKAGVTGLTKALAREWGRYNVTVNSVAFGLVRTRLATPRSGGQTLEVGGRTIAYGVSADLLERVREQVPLGRVGEPDDAAGAVYFLCSPDSNYVTAQTLVCDGGLMM